MDCANGWTRRFPMHRCGLSSRRTCKRSEFPSQANFLPMKRGSRMRWKHVSRRRVKCATLQAFHGTPLASESLPCSSPSVQVSRRAKNRTPERADALEVRQSRSSTRLRGPFVVVSFKRCRFACRQRMHSASKCQERKAHAFRVRQSHAAGVVKATST